MSHFLKSIDDMIASEFTADALHELSYRQACDIKDRDVAEKILDTLIRCAIAHARMQVDARKPGTMTFDQAMEAARAGTKVTRPSWDILCLIAMNDSIDDEEKPILFWKLDNYDGTFTGDGWPYNSTDEDRAATDWMLYQSPQDNWVELDL